MVTGCSSHCPVPPRLAPQGKPIIDVHVYIAPEFTERERDNIINGILMWERATNGLIVWHLFPYDPKSPPPPPLGRLDDGSEQRSVLFRRALSSDGWIKKWDDDHKQRTLLGLYHGDSMSELAWLWLIENRLATPAAETIIAAHEFGHAIGLDHIEDKASTMSELYNSSVKCLTAYDLQEFCKKHGCDVTMMVKACKPE